MIFRSFCQKSLVFLYQDIRKGQKSLWTQRKLKNIQFNTSFIYKIVIGKFIIPKIIKTLSLRMRPVSNFFQLGNTLFKRQSFSFFATIKYTKNHEWVQIFEAEKKLKVEQLGQIVHVDLPSVGKVVNAGESTMAIESVKMAADVYAPASGTVVNINESVSDQPHTVNEKAEDTWLFEIEYEQEPKDLLSTEQYGKLAQESH